MNKRIIALLAILSVALTSLASCEVAKRAAQSASLYSIHSTLSVDARVDGSADVWPCSSSSTIHLELPDASGVKGRVFVVKNLGRGSVEVTALGCQTIDEEGTTRRVPRHSSISLVSAGSGWLIF